MKTFSLRVEDRNPQWYTVDASGKTLGRLASALAFRLRGKHKPEFTPHVDAGDFFVVLNADKVHLSGKKAHTKVYYRTTGTAGGLKQRTYKEMLEKKPEEIVYQAVKGMLPRGPLGRQMLKKLRVVVGTEHKYAAQQPQPIDL